LKKRLPVSQEIALPACGEVLGGVKKIESALSYVFKKELLIIMTKAMKY